MKEFTFIHHKLGIIDRFLANSYSEAANMVGIGYILVSINKL